MDSVSVLNPKLSLNHTHLSHSPNFHPLLKHRHTTFKLSLPRYALNQRTKPLTLVFAASTPQHDSVSPKGTNFVHFLKWGSSFLLNSMHKSLLNQCMYVPNFNFQLNLLYR